MCMPWYRTNHWSMNSDLFTNKDFDSLTYNVMGLPKDANVLAAFPSLGDLPSFKRFKSENKNKIVRYIVLCYDKGSPILKRYMQDDVKRKVLSAQYAGFEGDDEGYLNEEINAVMRCFNTETNQMIIDFLRLFNDPAWALLLAGLESYYQKLAQLVANDPASKRDTFQVEETKGKLFKQAQDMMMSLDTAAKKILGDENIYLKRDLYMTIDSEARSRLNITPERIIGI